MFDENLPLEPFWVGRLPLFLQKKIKGRYNFQKIISNMGWLFLDKVLRMGVGFIVGVWVARYLGPEQFGTINYGTAFVGIFGSIAALGLDNIVIREIVRQPDEKYSLVGTAFLLKLFASVFSFLLSVLAIHFFKSDKLVKITVAIIAAGMIFQSFDVIRFWFESQVKSKYVVIAQNAAFLIAAAIKIILLVSRASLMAFVWTMLLEVLLGAIGVIFYYKFTGEQFLKWKFRVTTAKLLLRDSWPLILSGLSIFVYMRISQIMLGSLLNEREVGIYSVVLKISELWYFIPTIVLISVYPKLINLYNENEDLYTKKLIEIMRVFFWFSLAVSIFTLIFSKAIVSVLYGKEYLAAAPVLSIHIFSGIIVSMSIIFSHRFILKNQQKISLYGTIFGGVVSIVLNFLLIPKYASSGAAIAVLIAYISPIIFESIFFDRTIGLIFLKSVFNLN